MRIRGRGRGEGGGRGVNDKVRSGVLIASTCRPGGGGGHSGTELLPTAKPTSRTEAVNAKIYRWLTHLIAEKTSGQL